jgi:hypothetical protein
MAMRELAQGKKGLTGELVDMMATLRPELSDASRWLIGALRFAVILQTRTPPRGAGTVFELPDGRAFLFAAASSLVEADRPHSRTRRGARVAGGYWRRLGKSRPAGGSRNLFLTLGLCLDEPTEKRNATSSRPLQSPSCAPGTQVLKMHDGCSLFSGTFGQQRRISWAES